MSRTREFHFSDGKSDKFWKITLEGTTHTVQYGRAGTQGQTQTKEFPSESEAQSTHDKLIQEKLRKGYQEQSAVGSQQSAVSGQHSGVSTRGSAATPPQAVAPPRIGGSGGPDAETPSPNAEPPRGRPTPNADQLRSLDLDPADWLSATWRPRTPLVRPEPAPFDYKEARNRLGNIKPLGYGWEWDWAAAGLSPGMSREEAGFWLRAMAAPDHGTPTQISRLKDLAEGSLTDKITLKKAVQLLEKASRAICAQVMLPLGALFSAEELVSALVDENGVLRKSGRQRGYWSERPVQAWCSGLRDYVLPYVDNERIAALLEKVRLRIDPASWIVKSSAAYYHTPDPEFFLGAALGAHEEIRALVESWPDDFFASDEDAAYYQQPQEVLFGLGASELVETHMRRLKLRFGRPGQIRRWLAHTEYGALDWVRDSILAWTEKDGTERLIADLARVKAPEAAGPMLELMLLSRAPRRARQWLEQNPAHAALGLIPVAAGRGRLAEAAVEHLRALRRKEGAALVSTCLERQPEEVAARVRPLLEQPEVEPFTGETTPAWLHAELGSNRAARPGWVSPDALPPVLVEGRRLNDEQVAALLAALAKSTLEAPAPLVRALREHADPASLDRFAWRLFELWLHEGAPSKEKWAMQAVGLCGGDASALRLAPMIRVWPGESQHQRAVLGLEVLRTIGTDTALMQINGIAQKVQFKGIKTRAGECMEAIARDRGLTRAELEDRIVPDCDLDERGSRTFDFGPRQFRFVLGPSMKPMVREADGKLRPDLPKPTGKDDAALAAHAAADWKLLKKQVADVAKIQAARLEQAMVTGRRWRRKDWELLLVRHPLMTHLVRLLVWGAHDAGGGLAASFRVTEDLSYADSTDDVFALDPYPEVGIVHPLHLSGEERAAWGELLSDYEIVPPFSQLGRPILGLEAGETEADEISRFRRIEIPPQTLVFGLEKLGWERGIPEDAGVFYSHSKPFYGAGVTAIVEYEKGVPVGYMEGWDDLDITRCYFIPEIWSPRMYPDHKRRVPLGEVDPVVISEVLGDLTGLAARGK